MKGIAVDADARTVRAEAGLNWGEFDAATQEHGLAVTGGRVPDTGIAGLALGSGSGWLERKFGFTCDNLHRAPRSSPPTAAWCTASADRERRPVLGPPRRRRQLRHRHRVPPPAAPDRPDRVRRHARVARRPWPATSCGSGATSCSTRPTRSAAALAFITAPPADFVPEPVRGHPVVGCVVLLRRATSTRASGCCAPLREFGPPGSTCSGRCRTSRCRTSSTEANPHGRRNYWSADFLAELPDEAVDTLVEQADATRCRRSADAARRRWRQRSPACPRTRPRSASAPRR